MTTTNVAVTDEVVREIGEQVSQVLRRKMSGWGGTALDLIGGIEMYQGHRDTYGNLQAIRTNKDGSPNRSEKQRTGKSFEELDAADQRRYGRRCGHVAYTTDDLAKRKPDDPLFKKCPELKKYAVNNHPETDVVRISPKDSVTAQQHKNYQDPRAAGKAFMKDLDNDEFRVPSDQYTDVCEGLDEVIAKGGEKAIEAEFIKKKLVRSNISANQSRSPRRVVARQALEDAMERAASNVAGGVVSDLAVFAVGGATVEIREAYRNPDEVPLLDRCIRLVRTIWERLRVVLKDRFLREVGTEAITALASVLTAPLRNAASAVEKIVKVLRRLWMVFVAGKLKTLADVVSRALQAVYTVASVGVAFELEKKFKWLFAAAPFGLGDILAALSAAVVSGVMIVVGNRAIDHIVRSLFAMFQGAAIARRRREQIEAFCDEQLPCLIADRKRLEALVESHLADRDALFACTFAELSTARDGNDVDGFLKGLQKLNQAYGKALPWRTHREFDDFMLDDSQSLKL